MKHKYLFVALLLLFLAAAGFGFTKACTFLEEKPKDEGILIVTSFYPMYVAALNVADGCDGVRLENLSQPQTGCLHDYQLTPQDMILLSQADIFIVNGGGIESFLEEIAADFPSLKIINAGADIFQEENHEEQENGAHNHQENAHAWLSISHYMEQVAAIRDGLMEADALHADFYQAQAEEYLQKIAALKQSARGLEEAAGGENIIIFHEAFEYLAEDYGMQVAGELNLDEERQVSAREAADMVKLIKDKKIQILLAEDLYGRGMGDTIEKETDCKVYYLDTLVRGEGSLDSWLAGMEQNIEILEAAFGVED